jgi:hypothetical protein
VGGVMSEVFRFGAGQGMPSPLPAHLDAGGTPEELVQLAERLLAAWAGLVEVRQPPPRLGPSAGRSLVTRLLPGGPDIVSCPTSAGRRHQHDVRDPRVPCCTADQISPLQ